MTEAGRQKLREAAFRNKPWRYSTGPRTAEGKAKSALNAKKRQTEEISVRERKRAVRDAASLLERMAMLRQQVLGDESNF